MPLTPDPSSSPVMVGEDMRDTAGQFLPCRDMQEFVRAMGIGIRTENAGDEELRLRIPLTQHVHEGNRTPLTHVCGLAAKEGPRSPIHRLKKPRSQLRGTPTRGALTHLKA